uniref:Ribonuclease H-like domain-containing protein n=1 Tax=Tanacetum cinerariifolium TaxID=118510 RepID=A0A6L2KK60_TANCI|nr:ribonuclease H-like domain-containing protein [Tanacetum cinerariifolium]
MPIHNSEHNTPINSDHDDNINDSVTEISKLDISDPLHLHHNDTIALTVVSIKLKGTENYQVWSCVMLLALEGKNKIGFIDGSCKKSNTNEVLGFKKHNQLLKLMQFLMALDDSYMKIRSSILSRKTLSDVRSAYAIISSKESHRIAVGSWYGYLSKRTKTKQKRTKPGTRMKRIQEIKVEGEFISNLTPLILYPK